MGILVGLNQVLMAVKGEGLAVENDGVVTYPVKKGIVLLYQKR